MRDTAARRIAQHIDAREARAGAHPVLVYARAAELVGWLDMMIAELPKLPGGKESFFNDQATDLVTAILQEIEVQLHTRVEAATDHEGHEPRG